MKQSDKMLLAIIGSVLVTALVAWGIAYKLISDAKNVTALNQQAVAQLSQENKNLKTNSQQVTSPTQATTGVGSLSTDTGSVIQKLEISETRVKKQLKEWSGTDSFANLSVKGDYAWVALNGISAPAFAVVAGDENNGNKLILISGGQDLPNCNDLAKARFPKELYKKECYTARDSVGTVLYPDFILDPKR